MRKEPIDAARAKLEERVRLGRVLRDRAIVDMNNDLTVFERDLEKWSAFNQALLVAVFTTDRPAQEYRWASSQAYLASDNPWFKLDRLKHAIDDYCANLESWSERLDVIPPLNPESPVSGGLPSVGQSSGNAAASPKRVFIVHGRNGEALAETARFIEQLQLTPVILHEQPNGGRTLIEKLEYHSRVDFALVLMTPDDTGALAAGGPSEPRARQNVVLELGFFVGRLGRDRVCALHQGPLTMPSDMLGVVYVELDGRGAWKLELARELAAAGFQIDLNRAL